MSYMIKYLKKWFKEKITLYINNEQYISRTFK